MVVLQGNLGLYFQRGHGCSLAQLRPLFSSRNMVVLWGHPCAKGARA